MLDPRDLQLPYDVWRAGQRLAIRTGLVTKYKHIVIQAPTGSGKSAIAGGIAQIGKRRTLIATATNGLMEQYESAFPWLNAIRGAGNYQCLAATDELRKYFRMIKHPSAITCDDGPCRIDVTCSLKERGCLYFDAQRAAKTERSVLTNYAYLFAIYQYGQGLNPFDRVVCDEAHDLPDQLMKASEIRIPKHLLRSVTWPTTIKGWRDLAESLLTKFESQGADAEDTRLKTRKIKETIKRLASVDIDTWAYDVGDDDVVFQPVVPRLLMPLLTSLNAPIVYLSATITKAMLDLLGVDTSDVLFHQMPSRFAVEHRPIYILKTVRVDNRWSEYEQAEWHRQIDRIIRYRQDRKGIIHSVSYGRAREIYEGSKYKSMMLLPSAKELPHAVRVFKASSRPLILVSPSIATGYDFKHDEARYQIIAKLPFADTRSNIMKARIEHTDRYSDNYTMQQIVQAAGRIVRDDDDWGETFVIDNHADWFLDKNTDLSPEYFQQALQWIRRIPPPPPL